jgi:DNA invertase Pin-like site-specific DNA recombinase
VNITHHAPAAKTSRDLGKQATATSWGSSGRRFKSCQPDTGQTIRDRGERGIVLRSLREGIDTSNATGRMVAGVLASLAELELELGRERRTAARDARRARGQAIGRPKALDESKAALAHRMHASGESASTIATALGVSRATVYRVLTECNEVD